MMMTQFIYEWEKPLHQLAFQHFERSDVKKGGLGIKQKILDQAYQLSKEITQENSKTFFLASSLLSPEKRKAIRALYAFCRISDDLVDIKKQDPRNFLENWINPIVKADMTDQELIALAWADARHNYDIPWIYSEQLIDGVAQDFTKTRYTHFEELAQYSYRVASTVGLMSMHIIGFKNDKAYPYAIRLGVALQLTNILRDVGEDWRNGRVYLPEAELAAFDLSYEDIARGVVTSQWRNFMRFQIARNHRLYAEAKPGIALLNKDGRFAIAAAAELYQGILSEIEKNDFDVFINRASVSKIAKLRKLPVIWRQTKV
jgi:15-cis-phytoene synthase